MAALFVYYFVTDAIRQAVRSVVGGGRLILNTAFPRVLLPGASVITAFKRFLPTIVIFIPVYIIAGLPVGPELLWLIPVFALFAVMATGLAMLVAAGQVYFRDLKNFLTYALRIWLYGSPILYFAAEVPERYQFLLCAEPARAAADRVERRDRPRHRARPDRSRARRRLGVRRSSSAARCSSSPGSVSSLSVSKPRDPRRGRVGDLPHVARAQPDAQERAAASSAGASGSSARSRR